MAKRIRSKDGRKETEEILGEGGEIDHTGGAGGELQRDVGTRDQIKRAKERPAGASRPTAADSPDDE